MTTSQPIQSRLAARQLKGLSLVFSAMLLCMVAAPALADDASTTGTAVAAAPLPDAMPLPDRALLMAGDINRLLAALPPPQPGLQNDTPVGERVQGVLKRALSLLGTPYRWGGTTTAGFDCSGLVSYVFRTALGIELPRVSRDQARAGERVERAALVAGDLVFFSRSGRNIDHVGIYLGEGQFVHSPRTGRDVTVSRLDTGYWAGRFMQATRVTES